MRDCCWGTGWLRVLLFYTLSVKSRQFTERVSYGTLWVCGHSVVSDSATPWTGARQAPLSMDVLGKNSGVGCHFLFQGIFPTRESNLRLLCLLYCGRILYPLSHQGSPVGS